MGVFEIIDFLRRESKSMEDAAGTYTREGIVMRDAAAKLEELQKRKGEER